MDGPLESWQNASGFIWPDPFDGPWLVQLGLMEVRGRMECVGVAVSLKDPSAKPTPVLTAKMVRTIPVGQFMERTRRLKAGSAETVAGLLQEEGRPAEAEAVLEQGERYAARVGRPHTWGDDHYRRVASVYSEAWRDGNSPTQAVEKHPYFAPISHSTAARWVRECRKRGFLGETEKRKAGGVLPAEPKEEG